MYNYLLCITIYHLLLIPFFKIYFIVHSFTHNQKGRANTKPEILDTKTNLKQEEKKSVSFMRILNHPAKKYL